MLNVTFEDGRMVVRNEDGTLHEEFYRVKANLERQLLSYGTMAHYPNGTMVCHQGIVCGGTRTDEDE